MLGFILSVGALLIVGHLMATPEQKAYAERSTRTARRVIWSIYGLVVLAFFLPWSEGFTTGQLALGGLAFAIGALIVIAGLIGKSKDDQSGIGGGKMGPP